jgi:hypothetical protein
MQHTKSINPFKNQLEVSSIVAQSNAHAQMLINAVTGHEMTRPSPHDSSKCKLRISQLETELSRFVFTTHASRQVAPSLALPRTCCNLHEADVTFHLYVYT